MSNLLKPKQAAEKLGVTQQAVRAQIKRDSKKTEQTKRFPHAGKCPCGKTWFIPETDL